MSALDRLISHSYAEVEVEHDELLKTAWLWMQFKSRPTYTWRMLDDLNHIQSSFHEMRHERPEIREQLRFSVYGSRFPSVFCYGGDLEVFANKIRDGDGVAMARYARGCIGASYRSAIQFRESDIMALMLVQGDALGGGFESVLSGQLVVAERGVKFGLPEIAFNLFPGMGAVSFLARRVGLVEAERMILSGRIVLAEELFEMGVVQRLALVGEGEAETRDYLRELNEDPAAYAAARRLDRVSDVTYDEILAIVMIWAEASLKLTPIDLRKMEKLVQAQYRKLAADPGMVAEDGRVSA